MGITPAPNNGTLRLPFKPIGLHSVPIENAVDPPVFSPVHSTSPILALPSSSAKQIQVDPVAKPTTSKSTDVSSPKETPDQPIDDNGENEGEADDHRSGSSISDFWDWFTGKVDEWWGKVKGAVKGEEKPETSASSARS